MLIMAAYVNDVCRLSMGVGSCLAFVQCFRSLEVLALRPGWAAEGGTCRSVGLSYLPKFWDVFGFKTLRGKY